MASENIRHGDLTLLDIRVGEADFTAIAVPRAWRCEAAASKYALLYATINTRAVLASADGEILKLEPGSLVSLVDGHAHQLADSEKSLAGNTPPRIDLFTPQRDAPGPSTNSRQIVAARVPLTANPLPNVLSPIIHVTPADKPLIGRLHQLLELALAAGSAPANTQAPILKRVAEILAIELTEFALERNDDDWLSRISDTRLQRVIGVMRVNPGRRWSVASLAEEACMSRSAFADLFRTNVGATPMDFLRRCRIDLAMTLLAESKLPLYAIAHRAGYYSASAFTRAFETTVGVSPGQFRQKHRSA